jgi:hypothetical protein
MYPQRLSNMNINAEFPKGDKLSIKTNSIPGKEPYGLGVE